MDLSSKWNISSGSSGSSYHKKSDNRISVGKNKTATEDDIWRGQAAAAPPTTPPPYFGRICPLSTTQHDLYFNRTNIEGFANAAIDEARTRKVDNISVNIQNELKKKRKAEEEARIAYEKGKAPVSTPSGNVISSNNSFSDRVTSSYINLNKRVSGIISLANAEINGNIQTIGNITTGNTNLNELTLSDKVGGAGISMKINKNGEIVIQDLDKLNFGIFDWINYVVDSSYNGVDANNNPVYIIVPDFADAELERELALNTKGLSEINIGGQGCALGQKFDVNQRLAKMNNLTDEENKKRQNSTNPDVAINSSSSDGAENNTPKAKPLTPSTNDEAATTDTVSFTPTSSNTTPIAKIDNPDNIAEATEQGFSNIIKNIRSNIVYKIISNHLKYIAYPFIYYRWFVKKLGIGFCRLVAKTQKLENPPTEDEERLVISKMGSLFSAIISIFITYNWFFLMFYHYKNERPKTLNLDYQRFKNTIPLLHFMMEYVFYPVDCLNWLFLDKIPGIIKWVSPNINNKLLFFVIYVITFQIVETYGECTVDLFYDSMKILLNHTLKPWDMKRKYSGTYYGDVEYSITAKTYWFFHIMIFSAQLPSFLPSFYRNALKGTKTMIDKSGIANVFNSNKEGDAADAADAAENDEEEPDVIKEIEDKINQNMNTEDFMKLDEKKKDKFEKAVLKQWRNFNTLYSVMVNNLNELFETHIKKYGSYIKEKKERSNEEEKSLQNLLDVYGEKLTSYSQAVQKIKKLMDKYIIPNIKNKSDYEVEYTNDCPYNDEIQTLKNVENKKSDKNDEIQKLKQYNNFVSKKITKLHREFSVKKGTKGTEDTEVDERIKAWVNFIDLMQYCLKKNFTYIKLFDKITDNNDTITENNENKTDSDVGNRDVGDSDSDLGDGNDIREAEKAKKVEGGRGWRGGRGGRGWRGGTIVNNNNSAITSTSTEDTEDPDKKESITKIVIKDLKKDSEELANMAKSAAIAAKGAATSVATGLAAWFSGMAINIIRLLISHYFVTISAITVSLYLIIYSLLGIIIFSKLDIFTTIYKINVFIRETSNVVDKDDIYNIRESCRGTLFERFLRTLKRTFMGILMFAADSIYVIVLLIIMSFTMVSYFYGIKSSKGLRHTLMWVNFIFMLILIAGHILFTFKTNLEKGVSYKKAVDIERTKEMIRLQQEAEIRAKVQNVSSPPPVATPPPPPAAPQTTAEKQPAVTQNVTYNTNQTQTVINKTNIDTNKNATNKNATNIDSNTKNLTTTELPAPPKVPLPETAPPKVPLPLPETAPQTELPKTPAPPAPPKAPVPEQPQNRSNKKPKEPSSNLNKANEALNFLSSF